MTYHLPCCRILYCRRRNIFPQFCLFHAGIVWAAHLIGSGGFRYEFRTLSSGIIDTLHIAIFRRNRATLRGGFRSPFSSRLDGFQQRLKTLLNASSGNAGGGVAAGRLPVSRAGWRSLPAVEGWRRLAGFAAAGLPALRAGGLRFRGVGFQRRGLPARRAGGDTGGAVAGLSLSAGALFFSGAAGFRGSQRYKTPRPAPLRLFGFGGAGSASGGGGRLSVSRRGRRELLRLAGGFQR